MSRKITQGPTLGRTTATFGWLGGLRRSETRGGGGHRPDLIPSVPVLRAVLGKQVGPCAARSYSPGLRLLAGPARRTRTSRQGRARIGAREDFLAPLCDDAIHRAWPALLRALASRGGRDLRPVYDGTLAPWPRSPRRSTITIALTGLGRRRNLRARIYGTHA